MQTALHIIWLLVPLFFMLSLLWAKLEEWSGKPRQNNITDLIRQGSFVFFCAVIAYIIDLLVLDSLVGSFPDDIILLCRVGLYPAILYLGALIFGGAAPVRIEGKGINSPKHQQRIKRKK